MAASATFALKAGVWFRRGRLIMVSPDSLGTACPLSGRNSTYRPVQISGASSDDKVEGNLDSQDIEQAEHLVEQGALVAIGPYQAFVDAHGERHGKDAAGRMYEQADSLHGMPHARGCARRAARKRRCWPHVRASRQPAWNAP